MQTLGAMQPIDRRARAGLLEGMARIEAEAYACMTANGASPVTKVYTAGGGAVNAVWTSMRSTQIGVPVEPSPNGTQTTLQQGGLLTSETAWHPAPCACSCERTLTPRMTGIVHWRPTCAESL